MVDYFHDDNPSTKNFFARRGTSCHEAVALNTHSPVKQTEVVDFSTTLLPSGDAVNTALLLDWTMLINSPRHYANGKFLPVWEVSTRLGSYVVDLLDPKGKKLPEQEVGFL